MHMMCTHVYWQLKIDTPRLSKKFREHDRDIKGI